MERLLPSLILTIAQENTEESYQSYNLHIKPNNSDLAYKILLFRENDERKIFTELRALFVADYGSIR